MINAQGVDGLRPLKDSTITYDVMGNPTSYLGKTLTWEGKQLKQINMTLAGANVSLNYDYDENGLRMQKQYSVFGATNTTSYYYNGSVLIGMETELGVVMRFSYDASGNVVSVDYSDDYGDTFTTYYYLRNAQGDIVKLIDGSGNTVVEYTYDSWDKSISVTGTLATTLGANQPFRYRGYVYDTETNWYYLQSRYYDPTTCRFISADVLLSTGQGVLGHNSFAYCNNSACNFTDDQGRRPHRNRDEYVKKPDYRMKLSKNRVERPDSGLQDLPDSEISRRARDKNLPGKERKRYQKEEKLRKLRNKQKRNSNYSIIPEFSIPSQNYTTYTIPNEQAFAMVGSTAVLVVYVIVMFGFLLVLA